jgi:hypothetical protein
VPLFKRRSTPEPTPEGPRDPDLPLSVDQAAAVRRLVRQAFAERGIEVVVEGALVRDDGGQQYFLHNLAAGLAGTPEADWPATAAAFAASLLDVDDVEEIGREQLERSTYLRLQPAAISDVSTQPTAPSVVDGLVTLLAVDLPSTVVTPAEEFWEPRGGVEEWRAIGTRNLSGLIGSDQVQLGRVSDDDYDFQVLTGDSFFTATLALLLPQVLAAYGGGSAQGVLLAVPFRHQLAWRPIDGPGVVSTLDAMVRFAVLGHADGAGPVSPHLFWVHDGRWEQLTRIAEDGTVSIEVSPELQAALEQTLR